MQSKFIFVSTKNPNSKTKKQLKQYGKLKACVVESMLKKVKGSDPIVKRVTTQVKHALQSGRVDTIITDVREPIANILANIPECKYMIRMLKEEK